MSAYKTETHDFGDGEVPAHRHPNGGGWVANTAHVDAEAHVGEHAQVSDDAVVTDHAWIGGRARIINRAQVSGQAIVDGHAKICDDAQVGERSVVGGLAQVLGRAMIRGTAQVRGNAVVTDQMVVMCQHDLIIVSGIGTDGHYTATINVLTGLVSVGCKVGTWEYILECAFKRGVLSEYQVLRAFVNRLIKSRALFVEGSNKSAEA